MPSRRHAGRARRSVARQSLGLLVAQRAIDDASKSPQRLRSGHVGAVDDEAWSAGDRSGFRDRGVSVYGSGMTAVGQRGAKAREIEPRALGIAFERWILEPTRVALVLEQER